MKSQNITRRTLCTLGTLAGALLASRRLGAQGPAARPSRKRRVPPQFHNEHFYREGKFQEEAAKNAYFDLCHYFGYPRYETVRRNLFVTDFGLGRFTEVGLGAVVWMNEKQANYASLEVFLLPHQVIPEHWHVAIEAEGVAPKMESWTVRYGATFAYGEGEPTSRLSITLPEKEKPFLTVMHETPLRPGEVTGIRKPLEKHWQQAGPEGCILTETSTYHTPAAVRFTNPAIKFG